MNIKPDFKPNQNLTRNRSNNPNKQPFTEGRVFVCVSPNFPPLPHSASGSVGFTGFHSNIAVKVPIFLTLIQQMF